MRFERSFDKRGSARGSETRDRRTSLLGALGFSVLAAGSGGCISRQAMTAGRYDGIAERYENHSEMSPEQREVIRQQFQERAREAVHLTAEQEQALHRRLDLEHLRTSLPEAGTTMNEIALEQTWQPLEIITLGNQINTSVQDLSHLTEVLTTPRRGALQIHITEETATNMMFDLQGTIGGPYVETRTVVIRGSEGADFDSLLPHESPRLHTERREEELEIVRTDRTEERARNRVAVALLSTLQGRQLYITEEGSFFPNPQLVNAVFFDHQSVAFYLQHVSIETRQTTDHETGLLVTEATLHADVLDFAPPENHNRGTSRAVVRPLFPAQE